MTGVETLALEGSQADLSAWLLAADEDELAATRRWWRRTGRAAARRRMEGGWHLEPHAAGIPLALAFALAESVEEATKAARWFTSWRLLGERADVPVLAQVLLARGPEFARAVIESASAGAPPRRSDPAVVAIASLGSAVLSAHGGPVPAGDGFVRAWAELVYLHHLWWRPPHFQGSTWAPAPLLRASDGERPRPADDAKQSLATAMTAIGLSTELLCRALSTPDALMRWSGMSKDPAWDLAATIEQLIASGDLEREPVLNAALTALARTDRPTHQRAVAAILTGCGLGVTDLTPRMPQVLSALPVVHGSLSSVLVTAATSGPLPQEDLSDLGMVVLARPEKAQRTRFLRHLANMEPSETREMLLTMAAGDTDAALAGTARDLLGEHAPPTAPEHESAPAWQAAPQPHPVAPFTGYSPTRAGLDQARSDVTAWQSATDEAAWLAMLTAWAHRDLSGLKAALLAERNDEWFARRAQSQAAQWAKSGQSRRDYATKMWSHQRGPDGEVVITESTHVHLPDAHAAFTDGLVAETLERLGALEELLSTPTGSDGTLELGELVARLRRCRTAGYGEYDLVQALLRVGPTDPAEVRLLEGLHVPAAPRRGLARLKRGAGHDAADVVRGWVSAGGLPRRTTHLTTDAVRTDPVTLPLPKHLRELDGLPALFDAQPGSGRTPWGAANPVLWLAISPHEVDAFAVEALHRGHLESTAHTNSLPVVRHAPGPFSAPSARYLVTQLAHPRLDSRLAAADVIASLTRRDALSAEQLAHAATDLLAAGSLSLKRLAGGLDVLTTAAGAAATWPTWVVLLDLVAAPAGRPTGAADVLRLAKGSVVAAVAHEGPQALPARVRDLAAARGSSKTHLEARALVAAAGPA